METLKEFCMGLPFKPRDWVADTNDRVARVRSVYEFDDNVYFDLVIFDYCGNCLGRVSPAEGGPRTFEPSCPIEGWRRIKEPAFPITLKWIEENGRKIARYWAGETLPPADWTPPKRQARFGPLTKDDRYRRALQEIADGHNDPRTLAKATLAR